MLLRIPSLSAALFASSLFASVGAQSRCDELGDAYPYDEEWARLSSNGTRAVYNVGIGSLLNYASQQIQLAGYAWPANQSVTPLTFATVTGIKREIRGCWRYQSARAMSCTGEEGEFCPPMLGAYFEIEDVEKYETLRKRECSYTNLAFVEPDGDGAPEGNYFAWGYFPDDPCNPAYDRFPDQISQSYFDVIIGGILSWDGMLTGSGRYTWDVATELALGPDEMEAKVTALGGRMPSLSWEERYEYALEWVRTTDKSPDLPWMDDRPCPFTGNGGHPMTPSSMLAFEHNPYGNLTPPEALGAAAPVVSPEFFDLVDAILVEGGWAYDGANNTIDDRYNPCDIAAEIDITRDKFAPTNEFYDDVQRFWNQSGITPAFGIGEEQPMEVASESTEAPAAAAAEEDSHDDGHEDGEKPHDSHDHEDAGHDSHDHDDDEKEEESGANALHWMPGSALAATAILALAL